MSDFLSGSKKVQDLKQNLEDAAEDSLERSMDTVHDNLEHHLRASDSVATGTLLKSILTLPSPPQTPGFTGQRIMAADYWRFLEFGTGIYTGRTYKGPDDRAPIEPILAWVETKGITPDPEGPYDTQYELAEAIAFSIRTGTVSHPFVRPVWRGPFGRDHVINTVMGSMQRALNRSF